MFHLHSWSKWNEPSSVTWLIWKDGTVAKRRYQSKTCNKCGKTQIRACDE